VTRLDRLARSTRDLLNTLAAITGKKARFRSLGKAWADTTTARGRLMLAVLGGLADVERDLIRTHTAEGRTRAQKRGQHIHGPFPEADRRVEDRGPPATGSGRNACRTRTQLRRRQEHDFKVGTVNDQRRNHATPTPLKEPRRTDITKEEAARRQVETAIALFFCEDDDIAIHVLASTASAILTGVCRSKGVIPFRDMFIEVVKPGYKKFASQKLVQAYNYFKHADRDAEDNLERFNAGINPVLLWSCCYDYKNVFHVLPSPLHVFFWWFVAVFPELILDDRFPLKDFFLVTFGGLHRKPEAEQRRVGRDLLRDYLLGRVNNYLFMAGTPTSGKAIRWK
jgi:hypothetical protein